MNQFSQLPAAIHIHSRISYQPYLSSEEIASPTHIQYLENECTCALNCALYMYVCAEMVLVGLGFECHMSHRDQEHMHVVRQVDVPG